MSTNAIEKSLLAIQACNPKNRLYLQVVGQGIEQHLAVVKKNWFGRLLMWLGLTSACMKKVSAFVSSNIIALWSRCPQEQLQAWVGRIIRYDRRHGGKMRSLVEKMQLDIFNLSNVKPQQQQTVPFSIQTPLQVIISPVHVPQTGLPLQLPTIVPTQNLSPPRPKQKALAPAKLPLTSVIEYQNCKDDDKRVYDLLRFYSQDSDQFQALVEVMTLPEIYQFADLEMDCFGLSAPLAAKECLPKLLFSHMSVEQLKALIDASLKSQWLGFKDDLVYRLGHWILTCRPSGESGTLLKSMVRSPNFKWTFIKEPSSIQRTAMGQVHKYITFYYLSVLLKSCLKNNCSQKLVKFIQKICAPRGYTSNPTCPLNPAIVRFRIIEMAQLAMQPKACLWQIARCVRSMIINGLLQS